MIAQFSIFIFGGLLFVGGIIAMIPSQKDLIPAIVVGVGIILSIFSMYFMDGGGKK